MDNSKRRVGRPKTAPRTGPLVLQEDRSRETVEVQINSDTARELAEYAAWVEVSSSLTKADATFTTVEYALREVFRRDRVWQGRRRDEKRPGAPANVARPAPPASSLASSTSLPPPPGHARTSS